MLIALALTKASHYSEGLLKAISCAYPFDTKAMTAEFLYGNQIAFVTRGLTRLHYYERHHYSFLKWLSRWYKERSLFKFKMHITFKKFLSTRKAET